MEGAVRLERHVLQLELKHFSGTAAHKEAEHNCGEPAAPVGVGRGISEADNVPEENSQKRATSGRKRVGQMCQGACPPLAQLNHMGASRRIEVALEGVHAVNLREVSLHS